MSASASKAQFTAIVLAANRSADDPVARTEGVANKCLADIAGTPMLVRVIDALDTSGRVGTILVSTNDPALFGDEPEVAARVGSGKVRLIGSGPSAPESISKALGNGADRPDYPVLVTTGDHALLSPEMVRYFCAETEASAADLAVGLARADTIRDRFPEAKRTYLRFRGGAYSGCNLFALRSQAALPVVTFWSRAEQYRKSPYRLIRSFGPLALVLFALGLLTLDQAIRMASRRLGARISPVLMPQAEAAIDVDKLSDLVLVRQILGAVKPAASPPPSTESSRPSAKP